MLILAIDTSGDTLGVSIQENLVVRAELLLNIDANHSSQLLPAIQNVLKITGIKNESVDLYACTLGPGSFTGIRVGVSTIKGLAMATGKPLVGLSSLEVLAANAGICSQVTICPMLDARKGQIYTGLYKLDASSVPWQVMPDERTDLQSFLSQLEKNNLCFLGSGALRYASSIKKMHPHSLILPIHYSYPKAGIIGALGMKKFQDGKVLDAMHFTPRYQCLTEQNWYELEKNNDKQK